MVAADGLAPVWRQAIGKHHDDIGSPAIDSGVPWRNEFYSTLIYGKG